MEGILLILIGLILLLYIIFEPAVDKIITYEGKPTLILWYNKFIDFKFNKKREWIKLFTLKE